MNLKFIEELKKWLKEEAQEYAESYVKELSTSKYGSEYRLKRYQYFKYLEILLNHLSSGANEFMPKEEVKNEQ